MACILLPPFSEWGAGPCHPSCPVTPQHPCLGVPCVALGAAVWVLVPVPSPPSPGEQQGDAALHKGSRQHPAPLHKGPLYQHRSGARLHPWDPTGTTAGPSWDSTCLAPTCAQERCHQRGTEPTTAWVPAVAGSLYMQHPLGSSICHSQHPPQPASHGLRLWHPAQPASLGADICSGRHPPPLASATSNIRHLWHLLASASPTGLGSGPWGTLGCWQGFSMGGSSWLSLLACGQIQPQQGGPVPGGGVASSQHLDSISSYGHRDSRRVRNSRDVGVGRLLASLGTVTQGKAAGATMTPRL